ncbi:MAG: M48 family metallopeptidase [Spongiibacteraceae bacterium]
MLTRAGRSFGLAIHHSIYKEAFDLTATYDSSAMPGSATTSWAAHAFHPSFPKGRSSGELHIDAGAVTFKCELPNGNRQRVSLPLSDLRIKLGGASDRLVFFEHPAYPEWSIYTSDLQVLKAPALLAHPELTASIGKMRGKRQRNHAIFVVVVLLVLALPVGLYFGMGGLTAAAARQVPVEWEQKLGQSAFAQYRLQHELLDDKEAQAELKALTEPLTAVIKDSRYPFEFHVVRDADLNAFALPGGVVVINSGLIERADNASELLGVLAHEISHVTERHGVRNIISSAGIVLTAQVLIGDASGLLATIASAAPLLLNQSYSRDFERDADAHGVALLMAANIDPHGMQKFFEKMIEHENKMLQQVGNDKAADAMKNLSRFLSTHPATEERIERIQQLSRDAKGPYRDLEPAFARLKAHLAANAPTDADANEEAAANNSAGSSKDISKDISKDNKKETDDANAH